MMLMTRGPVSFSCIVTLRVIVWEDLDMLSGTTKLLECLMINELIMTFDCDGEAQSAIGRMCHEVSENPG